MMDLQPGVWDRLEASLRQLPDLVGTRPREILMVSAHWEADAFCAQSNPHPPMIYDYGGFPEHTYRVSYPAPGSPELAARTTSLLADAGLPTGLDDRRGFDHGAFVPLHVAYPAADIPVVQLSIHSSYDPALHLAAGRALAPLRDEEVLIVGSGFSFHNLPLFGPGATEPSHRFDDWLTETVVDADPETRSKQLIGWAEAPSARDAHPVEDHLLPLMVVVGAAEYERATRVYHEDALMGAAVSSYQFGQTVGVAA
jgi:aromatic ring-opening dioxygenase catalytic subunit (LigB family)